MPNSPAGADSENIPTLEETQRMLPARFYQLGPIMGGALNNEASRVGVEKRERLTLDEIEALRDNGVQLLAALVNAHPEQGPSAYAATIASTLVRQVELEKREGL